MSEVTENGEKQRQAPNPPQLDVTPEWRQEVYERWYILPPPRGFRQRLAEFVRGNHDYVLLTGGVILAAAVAGALYGPAAIKKINEQVHRHRTHARVSDLNSIMKLHNIGDTSIGIERYFLGSDFFISNLNGSPVTFKLDEGKLCKRQQGLLEQKCVPVPSEYQALFGDLREHWWKNKHLYSPEL